MSESTVVTNRAINVFGFIHAEAVEEWKSQIEQMQKEDFHRPISLYFNSIGGEAKTTFDFYHFLRKVDDMGTPIVGIVIGECKSAAGIILLACRHREAFANAAFFIHLPVLMVLSNAEPEQLAQALEDDPFFHQRMAEAADDALRVIDQMQAVMIERTSLKAHEFQMLAISERIFNAFEALKFGMVHRIC